MLAYKKRDIITYQSLVLIMLGLIIALASIGSVTMGTLSSRIDILEKKVDAQADQQIEQKAKSEAITRELTILENN
jgi:hypothetical protein